MPRWPSSSDSLRLMVGSDSPNRFPAADSVPASAVATKADMASSRSIVFFRFPK